jgi:hypothetical protein
MVPLAASSALPSVGGHRITGSERSGNGGREEHSQVVPDYPPRLHAGTWEARRGAVQPHSANAADRATFVPERACAGGHWRILRGHA